MLRIGCCVPSSPDRASSLFRGLRPEVEAPAAFDSLPQSKRRRSRQSTGKSYQEELAEREQFGSFESAFGRRPRENPFAVSTAQADKVEATRRAHWRTVLDKRMKTTQYLNAAPSRADREQMRRVHEEELRNAVVSVPAESAAASVPVFPADRFGRQVTDTSILSSSSSCSSSSSSSGALSGGGTVVYSSAQAQSPWPDPWSPDHARTHPLLSMGGLQRLADWGDICPHIHLRDRYGRPVRTPS